MHLKAYKFYLKAYKLHLKAYKGLGIFFIVVLFILNKHYLFGNGFMFLLPVFLFGIFCKRCATFLN